MTRDRCRSIRIFAFDAALKTPISRMKKRLAIFGSTGSIGRNTLEVVREQASRFRVRYLTANRSSELLCAQVREFRPRAVAVVDEKAWRDVRAAVGRGTAVLAGAEALTELAQREDYDVMVSGLVGFAGMPPTLAAVSAGKTVALANKEALVVAGEALMRARAVHGAPLLPIDSEHSAILQCLQGEDPSAVRRIILTASGGPFRGRRASDLASVTRTEALRHPNWDMGSKITIDSATLMNKGLEVIEAHWLFGLPAAQIDVLVHPQSIIHSMVEFVDGSVKAQLGVPDMRIPIQYALAYPTRLPSPQHRLHLDAIGTLTFHEPDLRAFRCLRLAYDALEAGGTAPAALNAANEIAVQAFLTGGIRFTDIPRVIEWCLERVPVRPARSVNAIIEVDRQSRIFAHERIAQLARRKRPHS
jgi:1-deoxy-D-xylulose-5-phosphate reductoisomerase